MADFDDPRLDGDLDPAEFEEERRRLHARSSRSTPFVVAGLVAAVAIAFWALSPRSATAPRVQLAATPSLAPAPSSAPKEVRASRHKKRIHTASLTPTSAAPARTSAAVSRQPARHSNAPHSHKRHPHRRARTLPRLPQLPLPPPPAVTAN